MKKTSFNSAVLIFTISLLSLSGGLYSIPARAILASDPAPAQTVTLQINNELSTLPDQISLCENGYFRKGWDGTVKGKISEPGISVNSNLTIL
jgi:hypothetical protein